MISSFTYTWGYWIAFAALLSVIFAFVRNSWTLEQRLTPSLKLVFDDTGRDELWFPPQYGESNPFGFRVGMHNDTDQMLASCRIEVFDIIDGNGNRHPIERFPKSLQFQLQIHRDGGQIALDLESTRTIFANVVSLDMRNPAANILLRCMSPRMPIYLQRSTGHWLDIRAQTSSGRGDSAWFYTFVDCSGNLKFQKSSGPVLR